MNSILKTILTMLGGIEPLNNEQTPFEQEVIVHINSALFTLNQLGLGTKNFTVTGFDETWEDFCDDERLSIAKQYVYQKVRLAFDPPSSTAVMGAFKENVQELEWRVINFNY